MRRLLTLMVWLLSLLPLVSYGQLRDDQRERPDDRYLQNAFNNRLISPGYRYVHSNKSSAYKVSVTTVQVNVNANGENILGDAANEPSIAVNPVDPRNIVIGWRQFDNVNSNFRQAGVAYSFNRGETWTFTGVIDPGIFRSDPVLECDIYGNFYYNSLTHSDQYYCQVFISADGGITWDSGTDAAGGDKQWMAIDRSQGPGQGHIYTSWSYNLSSCAPGFFTRSTNRGRSYESCLPIQAEPYWGTMTVGINGELFVAGKTPTSSKLALARSMNARQKDEALVWDHHALVNMYGSLPRIPYNEESVNPVGLLGQVNVDVDRSDGPGRGNLYILSTIKVTSLSDPCDIVFTSSNDLGETWTNPVRVNDDLSGTNYQWFGTMSVAPNGRIDAVWLDTRDAPESTRMSALYYAYSLDQGKSWSPNERISEAFDTHVGWPNQNKMGDYFDMESDSSGAHLAWANTLNGEQDVYYSYIVPGQNTSIHPLTAFRNLVIFPNPVTETMYLQGVSPGTSIEILNVMGQSMCKLICQQTVEKMDLSMYQGGIYFVHFTNEHGETTIRKIVKQ